MAAPQEYTAQNPEPFQSQTTQRAPGFFWFYIVSHIALVTTDKRGLSAAAKTSMKFIEREV